MTSSVDTITSSTIDNSFENDEVYFFLLFLGGRRLG